MTWKKLVIKIEMYMWRFFLKSVVDLSFKDLYLPLWWQTDSQVLLGQDSTFNFCNALKQTNLKAILATIFFE
eukprot:m.37160 g.37160  ORF g.37160 m.37160 type:complete len:72 (+) comp32332_c1_seq2:5070-5285(+)